MKLPEIVGDIWYNSQPLRPEHLKDKVVLVNFWAYSCVKSKRILPRLREWWTRYRSFDFLLVGIHTPEFGFEKDPENVAQAINDFRVEWPVVVDSDYQNWKTFANQHWPSNYLFDQNGELVFRQFGEEKFAETEVAIQETLKKTRQDIPFPEVEFDGHWHEDTCFVPTQDIYCGYARGRLDNSSGYNLDMPYHYSVSNGVSRNSIALLGSFVARPEYAESVEEDATLLVHFRAMEVNLVMKSVGQPGARLKLMFDGKQIPEHVKGDDVSESGEIVITKPALYNLLRSATPLEGILSITAKQGNFQAYTFTFSGCAA